jgi:transposase
MSNKKIDDLSINYITEEVWVDINSFEGKYMVSNFGRIKLLSRLVSGKNGSFRRMKEKIVKPKIINNKNYIVLFVLNKKQKNNFRTYPVDIIVAKSFIENNNKYKYVNHIDGNTLNDSVLNLEWDIFRDCQLYPLTLRKKVIDDYLSGLKIIELEIKYKLSYYVLKNIIQEGGISIKPYSYYKRVPDEIREMIMIDFKKGLKPKELSIKYGYCKRFVTDLIEEEGFDSKEISGIESIKRKKKAISLYVNKELNCCEISKIIGVSNRTVLEWIEKEGVKKSMSEISCIMAQKGKKHHIGIKSKLKTRFGTIRTDSTYETERLFNLDKDVSIKFVERCKFRIPFFDELNKKHHYNPDFIIHMNDGSIIIEEVKPEIMLNKDFNPIKHLAGEKYCKENGYIFRIVTEKDIFKKTKK